MTHREQSKPRCLGRPKEQNAVSHSDTGKVPEGQNVPWTAKTSTGGKEVELLLAGPLN